MLEVILFFIVGLVLGFVACFLIYRRKISLIQKERREYDKQLDYEEAQTKMRIMEAHEELYGVLEPAVSAKRSELINLQREVDLTQTHYNTLTANLAATEQQAQAAADAIYEKNYALMQSSLENSAELLGKHYQDEQEAYQIEYLTVLKDLATSFAAEAQEKKVEIDNCNSLLKDLRAKTAAAVEASKRTLEIQEQQNYYKLVLSKDDIEEIEKLRTVLPYLKDAEPLNKVIWKVYYEKPYTDMIGRVVGSSIKTGIYKITNLKNNMCYVGQAVNVADRWKQHIKRGLGAEAPTRNKLYPAMVEFGVENFSFELIEECDRSLLDEREDYWQDYFKAKEFGYSIK